MYISQTKLTITNTKFTYNYGIKGGAIFGDSKSIISTFDGATLNNNFANSDGACIYITGNSQISITNSEFSENESYLTSSTLFFLGTASNNIKDSSFYSNNAYSNTISLMFANTDLNNVTIYNNVVYDQSTGLFIAFSVVNIINSIFNFTEFPNGYEYNWDAAYDYNLQG